MAREPISLEALRVSNLHENIDDAIEQMEQDVIKRPNIIGARSVTIKINMKPVIERGAGNIDINMPEVTCEVSPVKMPPMKTMALKTRVVNHNGESRVIINTGDPLGTSHVDQINFDDLKEGK